MDDLHSDPGRPSNAWIRASRRVATVGGFVALAGGLTCVAVQTARGLDAALVLLAAGLLLVAGAGVLYVCGVVVARRR